MSRKYTILSILMIILALGLVILPKKNDRKEQDPKNLLTSITQKSRVPFGRHGYAQNH